MISAMVKLYQDKVLRELGYKMLLQIHDEVIMEGPEENAEEALKRMIEVMENPLDFQTLVKLEVDANIGDNWYDAK